VDKLQITGEPRGVTDHAGTDSPWTGIPIVSASTNGVFAVGPAGGGATQQLVWHDRTGRQLEAIGTPDQFVQVRLSPDERRVALDKLGTRDRFEIWLLELESRAFSRFT